MVEHLKTVKDSQVAGQTPDLASNVIQKLIKEYKRKCNDADKSERVRWKASPSMVAAPLTDCLVLALAVCRVHKRFAYVAGC